MAARFSPGVVNAILGLLAGGLFPFCLSPFDWWPLAIVSVGGLYLLLGYGGARAAFWRSACYGFGLFAVGASWVYVSIHDYGHASPPLAILLTTLFVLVLALVFALPFTLYGSIVRGRPGLALLLFPSIWVLGEWFRGWLFTGFPWLYLGYAFTDTWLAYWAPVTGVLGIGWMAAFAGATAAKLCRRRALSPGLLASALAIGAMFFGGWLLRDSQWTDAVAKPLSVTMVQPAIDIDQKWERHRLEEILTGLLTRTETHWHSDLVIWPESAIPSLRQQVDNFINHVDSRARREHTALLTGIPTREGTQVYNSVIALGNASGSYHKRHLVPFGEYVPLEHWLRGTIEFFDLPMSAFSSGPAHQPLLQAGDHRVATLICYEIVFQDLVASTAVDADLLLTVSNDTWFGASIGPHQHFQMARMRAIENARPLLRATNDGITAAVDHRGKVVAVLPSFKPGVLTTSVLPRTGSTPFNRFGSLPVLIFCGLVVAGGCASVRFRQRQGQRSRNRVPVSG